jgi:hypothetical protein
VRRECRAQLERAVYWGFDVSHLGSHLEALVLRPEFFDVLVELAVEFALPIRLPDGATERLAGFPFRTLAADEGLLFPDHVVSVRGRPTRKELERVLFDLRPGVTLVETRPAADTPELRALATDWAARIDDHDALTHDSSLRTLAERAGITVIGFRALREAQRAAQPPGGQTSATSS